MKQKRKLIVALVLVLLLGALIFAIVTSSKGSNELTITFDCHGGTEVKEQIIKKGEKLEEPETPTKEGYEFVGWYVDGEKFDFNTTIEKEIKLEAKWLKVSNIKYTVSFDSNGGSKVDDQKIESGKKVTKPNDPTRSGYTFVEWTLDGKTYDFNSKVEKNITLVAVWKSNQVSSNTNTNNNGIGNVKPIVKPVVPTPAPEPEVKKYTVTFSYETGVYNEVIVEEGNLVTAPSSEYKNFIILSWLDDNGEVYDFSTPVTRDILLTPYCIEKISLLTTDGVKNIITTNLTQAEDPNGDIAYNQANITIEQNHENQNAIKVVKDTPLRKFNNGAGTPGEWYAMILDFGINPTLIEGVGYTIEDCDIEQVDRFVSGQASKTAFVVWLNAEETEKELKFKYKDLDVIVGNVKVIVENGYETMEYKPETTKELDFSNVDENENYYANMMYNNSSITIEKEMTENDGLVVTVTENRPMISYNNGYAEGKWFGFVLDLGMNPRNLNIAGYGIEEVDITDTAKFGVDSETAFIVWLNDTNLTNSKFVMNITNKIDSADTMKVTVDFKANTEKVVSNYGNDMTEEITNLSDNVIYEKQNKRFIIPVDVTEFTFTEGTTNKKATYDGTSWNVTTVTRVSTKPEGTEDDEATEEVEPTTEGE